MVFRRLLLVAALLSLSWPASAEPTADEREQARGLMDLGRKRSADGQHDAALEAYEAADKIMDVPTTSLAVSEALAATGRLIEARDRLLSIARGGAADEPTPFAEARRRAKQMAQELAVRIPSVRVELLSSTGGRIEGTELSIAGKSVDASALNLPVRIDPGKVVVRATAPEHEAIEREIAVEEGEHHVVSLVLRTSTDAVPTTFVVSPVAYIGIGLTISGVIAGAALGSAALAKSAALEDSCPQDQCPPELEDSADSMELFAHISTASFAVAGAGAVLAIIGFVFLSGEEPLGDARIDHRGLTLRF